MYFISILVKNNPNKTVIIWLITGCLLIFLMVIVGGITRLTNSGLSMVNWNPIMGVVPPIGQQQWQDTFQKYQQFPEYQKINFNFTLNDFKAIFFWEYLHRLIARIIGMVFLIPFLYFLFKKKLSKTLIKQCLIIFALGAFQGLVGWWMVYSGLQKNPDVSHFRLATHLVVAFLTFAYIFYVSLSLIYPKKGANFKPIRKLLYGLFVVVVLQIIYGAFVAGLNAGFVMNTWPKMGNVWINGSVTALNPLWKNFVEGIGGVQFVHRYLAIIVVVFITFIYFKAVQLKLNALQLKSVKILILIVLIQFFLGVFTLLYAVPIWLGVTHQIGAFLLLGSVIYSLSSFRK